MSNSIKAMMVIISLSTMLSIIPRMLDGNALFVFTGFFAAASFGAVLTLVIIIWD